MTKQQRSSGRELILLVEDSATQAQRTRLVLEAAGFAVHVCEDGSSALAAAADHEPDLVLLDLYLPDLSGREVARRLKANLTLSGIPIIFLTGVFRDVEDIITGLEQGADDYLRKPVEDGELVARVRACLRAKQTQRELGRLARLLLTVNQVGSQLAGIFDLETLLKTVVALIHQNFDYPHVHLFLVEADQLVLAAAAGPSAERLAIPPRLPLDGDSLAAASVRSQSLVAPVQSHTPLHPFLAEARSGAAAPVRSAGQVSGVLEIVSSSGLAFSANDSLVLQTLADLVGMAVHNSQMYQRLEKLAMVDELTGLLNRRTLMARLESEWGRSQRYKNKLAFVIVDVDYFKQVNDQHGHGTGDRALKAAAQVMKQTVRQMDVAGRFGGDEFLVILPETGQGGALEVAERLRSAGEKLTLSPEILSAPVSLTFSLGVASWPETQANNAAELLQAADQALYRAKAAGRNCASA
ncbi:MAG: diguanylate cyclase [Anaerolineales bacterium]